MARILRELLAGGGSGFNFLCCSCGKCRPPLDRDDSCRVSFCLETSPRAHAHTPSRLPCNLPPEIPPTRRRRDCPAELNSFLHALEPLASKLRVILIQLPPSFAPKDG